MSVVRARLAACHSYLSSRGLLSAATADMIHAPTERIACDAIQRPLDELARGRPAEVDRPRFAYERAVEDLRLGPANVMNAEWHR